MSLSFLRIACCVVIVFAIALGGLFWLRSPWTGNSGGGSVRPQVPDLPMQGEPVSAPPGQVTPRFPRELILDPQAAITRSYTIDYSVSLNQYTSVYHSSDTMQDLYNNYLGYLGRNGWNIVNKITTPTSLGVYAIKPGHDVSVAIVKGLTDLEVTVGYIVQ